MKTPCHTFGHKAGGASPHAALQYATVQNSVFPAPQDASGADENAAEEKGEAEKEVGRMGNGGALALHACT